MRRCPKFDSCSATICPLDPNWRLRDMTSSDATCTWLREMVKEGPGAQGVPEVIRFKVAQALPIIISSTGLAPLRAALKRAAKSRSRRDPARLASLNTLAAA